MNHLDLSQIIANYSAVVAAVAAVAAVWVTSRSGKEDTFKKTTEQLVPKSSKKPWNFGSHREPLGMASKKTYRFSWLNN